MVSRLYTTKSIADLLETYDEVLWASRATLIIPTEKENHHDNTVSNKAQISRGVTWAFCESQVTFELEFKIHSILFAWSNFVFSQGTTTWYYKRLFSNDALITLVFTNKTHPQEPPTQERRVKNIGRKIMLGRGVFSQRPNMSNSTSPDKMHPWVLRELIDPINRTLTIIFERLQSSGEMPADWKKANTIPGFQKSKNILIDKLRRHGVGRQTVRWIENCLNSRSQRLIISGTRSNWRPVTTSVPQHSVLGSVVLNWNYFASGSGFHWGNL